MINSYHGVAEGRVLQPRKEPVPFKEGGKFKKEQSRKAKLKRTGFLLLEKLSPDMVARTAVMFAACRTRKGLAQKAKSCCLFFLGTQRPAEKNLKIW